MKKVIIVLLLVGIAGGGWYWYANGAGNGKLAYKTVPVERGNLLATISATGPIEPEEVVDVGAQVAGMIREFGRDPRDPSRPVDYGAAVEQGTILARIDDSLYASQVKQAEAAVGQAQADVQRAEADLTALKAKLYQAERDWNRARKLGPTNTLSQLDYDTIQAAYETAHSQLGVGEAAILQAQKAQAKAEAALLTAQINLGYCTIRSPVKGVVIDRRVNIGQTVVSSLNAPSLFLIAKDLSRIQAWASVNEADIGHIKEGQPVHFTVDAFPKEVFHGKVLQIRLNANMTQNVVTYTVVVETPNPELKLKPYMTANLQFEVEERQGVLLVPNEALRFRPQLPEVAPDARKDYGKSMRRRDPEAEKSASKKPGADPDAHDRGTVWVEDNGFVRPIKVRIGLTDGGMTEITSDDLKEGTPIVTGLVRKSDGDVTSNPFTPKVFNSKPPR